MNKQEYLRYLESAHWKKTRAAKLIVAGGQCEFRPIVGEHPKHGFFYGNRCSSRQRLQVHHLHYGSIGAEKNEDLEVLCKFHHLVRHASCCTCSICGEAIEIEEEDAIDQVKQAVRDRNGIDNVTFDDVQPDGFCSYCDR